MVASILSLLPILALFAFAAAALYSIYLFWTGLGVLTQVPESRRIGYVLVSALSTFVIVVVFASIQAALSSPAIPPPSANYDELRDSMKQLFEHTLKDK
jgi:dolichyl-phosphate-mannose--protein O-mannosyl transferase